MNHKQHIMLFSVLLLCFMILMIPYVDTKHESQFELAKATVLYDNVTIGHLFNASYQFHPPPLYDTMLNQSIDTFLYDHYMISQSIIKSPLLCSTFIDASPAQFDHLIKKLNQLNGTCDWAILIYKGSRRIAKHYYKKIQTLNINKNRIVLYDYNMSCDDILYQYGMIFNHSLYDHDYHNISSRDYFNHFFHKIPYNNKIFPKPLLMMKLLPIVRYYGYVWMFDGDIAPYHFYVKTLLYNLHCSFHYPPLIAQPLIYEDTQGYKYFNYHSWHNDNHSIYDYHKIILAQETKFIEVQTPIFNGLFLEFFLQHIVRRVLWSVHILGMDYGFDNIFCGIATIFAERKYLYDYHHYHNHHHNASFQYDHHHDVFNLSSLTPCAVIVDGTPVHHHNAKVIAKDMIWRIRKYLSRSSINIFLQAFPSYFVDGKDPSINPLRNDTIGLKTSRRSTCQS